MSVLSFLIYVFVTSFTPGPNNIMAMANAHQFGLKRTMRFCLGVGAGFFVLMLLCSFFNLLLKNFVPKMEMAMTLLGAVYMLYLAYKILKSKPGSGSEEDQKRNSFFTGMVLQFINPKGILYGLTALSAFILPYYSSNGSLLLFSFFLAFIGFAATVLWSTFGSVFQRFLTVYRKQFNMLMALLLVYSAVSIVLH
ncbi:LysE family transporter [Metabacillus sp. GX 13764]|uniref:LysE family transporter n=1 Tax=Metabacillus kandeliae TaxID=2900151 RepID=UPI001E4B21F1|nr:LysE family transporter [Metabacillus kandeliae]MCD7034203.1 LysE family transporter [Metabacillus kandeliae]